MEETPQMIHSEEIPRPKNSRTDSLEVVGARIKDNTDKIDPNIDIFELHLVSGFLVFPAREKELPLQEYRKGRITYLTLSTLDFEIIDQSKKVGLRYNNPVRVVSSDRIACLGTGGYLYLHKVDVEAKKLVLIKELKLKGWSEIDHYVRWGTNQHSYSCLVRTRKDKRPILAQKLLVNFDKDLNLTSYNHHGGFLSDCRWSCPLPKNQILGCVGHVVNIVSTARTGLSLT